MATDPESAGEALQRAGESIRQFEFVVYEALLPNIMTAVARMKALGELLSEIEVPEDDDAPADD